MKTFWMILFIASCTFLISSDLGYEELADKAVAYFLDNDYENALDYFFKAIEKTSDKRELEFLYTGLITIYFETNDFDNVQLYYSKFNELDDAGFNKFYMLANMYLYALTFYYQDDIDTFKERLVYFEEILDNEELPTLSHYYVYLTSLHYVNSDYENASNSLTLANKHAGYDRSLVNLLNIIIPFVKGDYNYSYSIVKEILSEIDSFEVSSKNVSFKLWASLILFKVDQVDECIKEFNSAIEMASEPELDDFDLRFYLSIQSLFLPIPSEILEDYKTIEKLACGND